MDPFALCPRCHRHVHQRDAACPFCQTSMPARTSVGLALVLIGLSASMAACYGPPPRDDEPEEPSTTATGAGGHAEVDAGDRAADPN